MDNIINLQRKGLYYEGYVDGERNLKKFEEDLRIETNQKFSTCSRHTRDGPSLAKKPRYKGEGKLHWSSEIGGIHIPFSGTPFRLHSVYYKECMFGTDHRKPKEKPPEPEVTDPSGNKKTPKKRVRLQPSLKRGCQAYLRIREIKMFPEYKLPADIEGMKGWQVKKLKKECLERLRADMEKGLPLSMSRYYITCPVAEAHNHPLDSMANAFAQPVHPSIIAKIQELVPQGIDTVRDVKVHLREYVRNTVCKHGPQPSESNQGYFPTNKNIRNHINIALSQQKQKFERDQESLQGQIDQWKEVDPEASFYYRPNIERGGGEGQRQSLIFVEQMAWQKRLIQRYGEVCLLFANYKTMKPAYPIFFLVVKTNVSYSTVATFIVKDETMSHVQEALNIIKSWNPNFNPTYLMCDISDAQINALEAVFPTSLVYLCDSLRQKAWEVWFKKPENGVPSSDQKALLTMLENIANSTTDEIFQNTMYKLKSNEIWQRHTKVQQYITSTWLPHQVRWVKCYRHGHFNTIVSVNHGRPIVTSIKNFKENYLSDHLDKTFSGVVGIVQNFFLPDTYQEYIRENVKLTAEFKPYDKKIPEFLHERPHEYIQHVLKGLEAAKGDFTVYKTDAAGGFHVRSVTQNEGELWHYVNFAMPSCQCVDWFLRRWVCKHFCAIFMYFPNEYNHNHLPETYLLNPYIIIDKQAIEPQKIVYDQFSIPPLPPQPDVPVVEEKEDATNFQDNADGVEVEVSEALPTLESVAAQKQNPETSTTVEEPNLRSRRTRKTRHVVKPVDSGDDEEAEATVPATLEEPLSPRSDLKKVRSECVTAISEANTAAYLCHDLAALKKSTELAKEIFRLLQSGEKFDSEFLFISRKRLKWKFKKTPYKSYKKAKTDDGKAKLPKKPRKKKPKADVPAAVGSAVSTQPAQIHFNELQNMTVMDENGENLTLINDTTLHVPSTSIPDVSSVQVVQTSLPQSTLPMEHNTAHIPLASMSHMQHGAVVSIPGGSLNHVPVSMPPGHVHHGSITIPTGHIPTVSMQQVPITMHHVPAQMHQVPVQMHHVPSSMHEIHQTGAMHIPMSHCTDETSLAARALSEIINS
ncbi:hypothetical protein LOTGIDRAFT_152862 [Lottia gigantea]|uniref:ZSWIM1/3 RNaseH-like domain-containing protein n=1 Tax=Lottia gigantea TaxID=225164 RepID=V4ASB5_LOTGI|nr:hypothetical protein LOTGIDRAFT_152862 [Lottia gigantea]ESO97765.1 hypothetical protein LOTGIDRAFT_152862 [Lottia gigantea]